MGDAESASAETMSSQGFGPHSLGIMSTVQRQLDAKGESRGRDGVEAMGGCHCFCPEGQGTHSPGRTRLLVPTFGGPTSRSPPLEVPAQSPFLITHRVQDLIP